MTPKGAPRAYPVERIGEHVGGSLEGPSGVSIRGVRGIDEAEEGDLTFVANPKYRGSLETTRASAVLVDLEMECPSHLVAIRTPDPYASLVRVLALFDPGLPEIAGGVHATAIVHESAELAEDVGVGPWVVIGSGATIGRGTRLSANVSIEEGATLGEDCFLFPGAFVGRGCILGNRVRLQPGVVIGSDGFGYAPVDGRYVKIPQIGIVDVGDDVEIGANSCIDRATLGRTHIASGTKIDNLVQIAHNVAIGENCVIAGQAGIAGSAKIGRDVRLGGQAGISGHIEIGDGAAVAAQGGVVGDIPAGETYSGYPARPHAAAMRAAAAVHRLPDLRRRVRALEERLSSDGPEASADERKER